METNISPYIYFGTDKASATEIPPRKAPHVRIGIALFSKAFLFFRKVIGSQTDINLANKTIAMAIHPSQKSVRLNATINISKPIKRNNIAFINSSINSQNLAR